MPEYVSRALKDTGDDSLGLRNTFARFPTGVVAIAAQVPTEQGFERQVIVASSFQVGISLDPPLVLFAVQHSSSTWPRLREQGRLGVSVLSVDHADAVRQLASRGGDRFQGIDATDVKSGAIFIDKSPVWLECSIHAEIPAGDHDVVLLRVHATAMADGIGPLVWHGSGFRALESPPNDDEALASQRTAETSRYWVGPWSAIGQEALIDPDRYDPKSADF